MPFSLRRLAVPLSLAATAAAALPGHAQTAVLAPPPQNVVSLSASATVEVTRDLLAITLSTTREGPDAGTVQAQLRQALDSALAEARRAARSGQLEVQTGSFSLSPRYAPRTGGINGWQGTAELLIEGRDTAAIAQLAGRLQPLTIARVQFSLSRAAREKVESDVAAQAIDAFRVRAEQVTRQFGFAGYALREVAVQTSDNGGGPQPMFRAQAARGMVADESLPVEAGRAQVTATVSGSVTMSPR